MSRLWPVGICTLALAIFAAGQVVAQEVEQDTTGWMVPLKVMHELEGRSQCLMCHAGGVQEAQAVPTSHVDRPDESCMWCHAPNADVQTITPPPTSHKLEGRSRCLMCHLSETLKEVPQVPATHAGRTEGFCTLCHVPDEKG